MLHKDAEQSLIKAYKFYNSKMRYNLTHDYKFAHAAFMYQMNNFEYGYTQDLTDILDALKLTKDKINKCCILRRALKHAHRDYMKLWLKMEDWG